MSVLGEQILSAHNGQHPNYSPPIHGMVGGEGRSRDEQRCECTALCFSHNCFLYLSFTFRNCCARATMSTSPGLNPSKIMASAIPTNSSARLPRSIARVTNLRTSPRDATGPRPLMKSPHFLSDLP